MNGTLERKSYCHHGVQPPKYSGFHLKNATFILMSHTASKRLMFTTLYQVAKSSTLLQFVLVQQFTDITTTSPSIHATKC